MKALLPKIQSTVEKAIAETSGKLKRKIDSRKKESNVHFQRKTTKGQYNVKSETIQHLDDALDALDENNIEERNLWEKERKKNFLQGT